MSAQVALALLALGTPAARPGIRTPGQPEPSRRDVTTAIAALAAQFRETSLAARKPR